MSSEFPRMAYVVEGSANIINFGYVAPSLSVILAVGEGDIRKIKGMAETSRHNSREYLVPRRYFLKEAELSQMDVRYMKDLTLGHRFHWNFRSFQGDAGVNSDESMLAIENRTAFNEVLAEEVVDAFFERQWIESEASNQLLEEVEAVYSRAKYDADQELLDLREDLEREFERAKLLKADACLELADVEAKSKLLDKRLAEYESHYTDAMEETIF